jgi:translation initiation factor 2 beta subunit (eIF-2beta)/eIF-5
MGCYTCEGHNDQLVERIERMCEAVCAECAAKAAFVDAQKWPLPPRDDVELGDAELPEEKP